MSRPTEPRCQKDDTDAGVLLDDHMQPVVHLVRRAGKARYSRAKRGTAGTLARSRRACLGRYPVNAINDPDGAERLVGSFQGIESPGVLT